MKNKIINLKKNKINSLNFSKKELKRSILKSILQNNNSKQLVRNYCCFLLSSFLKKKKSQLSKINKVCLKTGKLKGFLKNQNFNRHQIKILSKRGLIINFKKSGW